VRGLSGGPAPPEALQFEPVDTTDLVQLSTGDFVYNLPLLAVPGPAGDYPINLSYHAGIGPNEEGTWVGLGWSLNPGAVTRTVSGYPDDYRADYVQTHFATDTLRGFGVGVGVGYGPVGLNVSYDSYTGTGGVNFFATLGYTINENLSVGLTTTVGSNGISGRVGATASYGGVSAQLGASYHSSGDLGLHANLSIPGNTSVGYTLSTQGSGGNYSVAGIGFSSMAAPSTGTFDSVAVNFMIPLPYIWVSLAYSHWTWRLDETYEERSYGYLYQSSYLADPAVSDSARPNNKKYERHKQGRFLYASQDLYQVNAQGLSGVFMPFVRHGYSLVDWSANEYKAVLGGADATSNPRDEIVFRFLGDPGANLITGAGSDYVNMFSNRFASKLIAPSYATDGKITGFTITDADGKQYRFEKPVYNDVTYSWSRAQDNLNSRSYTLMASPYSSAWLLSEIRGPDFVDRDNNGTASDGDWGYWVRFEYSTEVMPNVWRSPYTGLNPGLSPDRPSSASFGLSDLTFLEQIETASHIAVFRKSLRKDRMTARLDGEDLTLQGTVVSTTPNLAIQPQNNYEAEVEFNGKWKAFFDSLGPDRIVVRAKEIRILVTNNRVDHRWWEFRDIRRADVLQCDQIGNRVRLRFRVDQSDIDKDIQNGALPYTRFEGLEQVLLVGNNLVPAPFRIARRLDRIDLFSKRGQGLALDAASGHWRAAPTAVPIKSVSFGYDYSLAAGTPNSAAMRWDGANKGRLTLKSVTLLGENGAGGIPPYRFEYANGETPGSVTVPNRNPTYYANGWDYWGSYRYPILDNTIVSPLGSEYEHDTPQQKTYADYAAAWSLTKIKLPTGGAIEIDYESDDYYHVGNTIDLRPLFPEGFDSTQVRPTPTDKFIVIAPVAARNTFTVPKHAWPTAAGPSPGEYIAIVGAQIIPTTLVTSWPRIYLDTFPVDNVQTVIEGGVEKYRISFSGRTYTFAGGRNYFVALYPRKIYGGGIRVAQLTSVDGDKRYATRYRYETDDGRSTGVTASLHQVTGIPLDPTRDQSYGYRLFVDDVEVEKHEDLESFTKLFIDYPKSFRRPAPGVMYERVEVFNADEKGQPLNGKTVFAFFTAKDRPYEIDDNAPGSKLTTYDVSGLYGKPKWAEYFEQTATGLRPVRRSDFGYVAGEELSSVGRVFDSRDADISARLPQQGTISGSKPLGLIEERYLFYEHEGSDRVENQLRRQVVRYIPSFFATTTQTTENHFAQDGAAALQTRIQKAINMIWDAASGLPIAQASTRSDGRLRVSKWIPAYWKYSDMAARNMLWQKAQETSYLVGIDINNIEQLKNYTFPHQDIVASEAKTWHLWTQAEGTNSSVGVWRENDTFRYIKTLDLSDGIYHPFNNWQYSANAFPDDASDHPWHMTSNITSYNRYSHPIEEARRDGSFVAALFDDTGANPIAIADRARQRDIFYFDFESPAGLNTLGTASSFFGEVGSGRTGLKAFKAYASASPWYRLQGLRPQTEYLLSFWARRGSADVTHPIRITLGGPGMSHAYFPVFRSLSAGGTDWQFVSLPLISLVQGDVELHIDLQPKPSTGGLFHYVDDLRIHPAEGTMRTFTYTPLTRQVSSITNENSISSFYEYDNVWRLRRVRDHRRNILKQYEYYYPR
jgi:hypothetical protein